MLIFLGSLKRLNGDVSNKKGKKSVKFTIELRKSSLGGVAGLLLDIRPVEGENIVYPSAFPEDNCYFF